MNESESMSVEIAVSNEKGRPMSMLVSRAEIEKFLNKYEWEEEDINAVKALKNKMNSLSGFFRFCQSKECPFNAYGELCKSRKKQCVSFEDSISVSDEDKGLLLTQTHVVRNVSNGDVPLKTIFRCLLRDYHKALDTLEDLKKENEELKSHCLTDEQLEKMVEIVDSFPNNKAGRKRKVEFAEILSTIRK